MKRWRSTVLSAFLVSILSVFLFLPTGFAGTLSSSLLASYQQGDKILSDTPTYNWWYGCSPTSAGMMVGYYDRKGYAGLNYSNLVKNGVAEKTTYPSTEGSWDYLAQSAIASKAHVDAFYRNGYNGSGDDIARVGSFDSLADFMGTNQDAHGNSNGSTTFYYWTDGAAFTAQDALDYGVQDDDGMYGIMEYLQYSGYDVPSLTSIYTQAIYSQATPNGFTFDQYKAEIDAGRVVMIQVEGHSMFGYGYGDNGLIYFNDTWTDQEHTMTWGGSYAGMDQWGVVCFELTGGSAVPLPPSVLLLGFGLAGIGGFRFRNLRRK